MMGERENPSDSIDYTVPQILLPDVGVTVGSHWEKRWYWGGGDW